MVELEIRVDTKKVNVDLEALKHAIGGINQEALIKLGSFAVGTSQKKYLMGPRPEHLGVRTARLINSIQSEVRGGKVYVGSNAVSDNGFNYPEYWETSGREHGGPRPFLKPLVTNEWEGLYRVWLRKLKTGVRKWLERR